MIKNGTIHKVEVIRIKSDAQEMLEKHVEDLHVNYKGRIEKLKGRVATHDKHYKNWSEQIRTTEKQAEKAKESYEAYIVELKDKITDNT